MNDCGPQCTRLGEDRTATHLLTHANWNSDPWFSSRGCNETGVRRIEAGEIVTDSFELIQHGWYDWQLAGEVIQRLLAKGRTPRRIADVMDFIRERGGVNRPPKAKMA